MSTDVYCSHGFVLFLVLPHFVFCQKMPHKGVYIDIRYSRMALHSIPPGSAVIFNLIEELQM